MGFPALELHKPLHVRNKLSITLLDIKMRVLLLSIFSLLLFFLHPSEAEIGNDGRTFGSCDTLRCMVDQGQASYCCNSGRNRRCCNYGGGSGWDNGNHGGYNNNKPGSCPSYNGRRKRSPEEAPWSTNGGRYYGGGGRPNGGYGNNGWNDGGSGYNPGYNGGWNNGGGRCIRDSECPGSLKCCFLYNGYQCTQPQYYG